MNATDRTAALIESTIKMITTTGWGTAFDIEADVMDLPRPDYGYVAWLQIDLDAAALREIYSAILAEFGPRDETRRRRCGILYNAQLESDCRPTSTRAGTVGPVQHLNALVWALMWERQEQVYAEDMAENARLMQADAFWTALSNGVTATAARDLAAAV
ncbi:MAG: hypothetical protein V3S01_08840 [Dehalococcoidia bacterium]